MMGWLFIPPFHEFPVIPVQSPPPGQKNVMAAVAFPKDSMVLYFTLLRVNCFDLVPACYWNVIPRYVCT